MKTINILLLLAALLLFMTGIYLFLVNLIGPAMIICLLSNCCLLLLDGTVTEN